MVAKDSRWIIEAKTRWYARQERGRKRRARRTWKRLYETLEEKRLYVRITLTMHSEINIGSFSPLPGDCTVAAGLERLQSSTVGGADERDRYRCKAVVHEREVYV